MLPILKTIVRASFTLFWAFFFRCLQFAFWAAWWSWWWDGLQFLFFSAFACWGVSCIGFLSYAQYVFLPALGPTYTTSFHFQPQTWRFWGPIQDSSCLVFCGRPNGLANARGSALEIWKQYSYYSQRCILKFNTICLFPLLRLPRWECYPLLETRLSCPEAWRGWDIETVKTVGFLKRASWIVSPSPKEPI